MAVDTTLISGAYKANAPQGVVGSEEITNMGKSITTGLKAYMAGVQAKHTIRNAEYDAFSESVLDNSELVGDQYESLYDELAAGKDSFADADKKGRDLQVRDLKAMAGDYAEYKELREDIAINKDDLSPAFTNSPEGEMYLDILKGDGKNLVKKDGRIGIEVEGEWKSISSIKQSLNSNKIDSASIEQLEAFRIKTQSDAGEFDYNKTRTTLMNSMVSKGKYKSLINDEIIPGRVFRNDLMESLTNKTYSDLGITEEDLMEVEGVDISDGIDHEEAEAIATHLEEDEIEMKEVLADYYTTYVNNNSGDKKKSNSGNASEDVEDESVEGEGNVTLEDGTEVFSSDEIDTMYEDQRSSGVDQSTTTTSTNAEDNDIDADGVYTPTAVTTSSEEPDRELAMKDNAWYDENWQDSPKGYSVNLSNKEIKALKPLSVSNKHGNTNILINDKKIIMKGIKNPAGGIFGDVSVDGVRAEGTSIVIDSNFGEQGFGKFEKKGDKYVWAGDEQAMKMFEENATPEQKESFHAFIAQVEKDPVYAESLIKHVNSGSGKVNASTLK